MEKIALSDLGLTVEEDTVSLFWNEIEIKVRQYLPVTEKLELITNVINRSEDENNFANSVKVNLFCNLEIVDKYTNISVYEEEEQPPAAIYDNINNSGLLQAIKDLIPEKELNELEKGVADCVKAIYDYHSSLLGIMEATSNNYDVLEEQATDILEKLSNPENLALLRDVMGKLG